MALKDDDETRPIDRAGEERTPRQGSTLDGDRTAISNRERPEAATAIPERRIGRYRLIRELGQGGQGAVYLAEDDRLRRRVALKVLFGGLVHSHEARLRFDREAEATGRLNHPSIARIYEIGEAESVPFIAMELVEGETLAARLSTARTESNPGAGTAVRLEFERSDEAPTRTSSPKSSSGRTVTGTDEKTLRSVARFLEAAARAIHVAHENGLVHRDLKPANIMVRQDGSPCVLDFGLAHDETSAGAALTGSNDRFGTPSYMAPEQVRGKTREIDRRTDVWALGATLYECCTLKRPFEAPTCDELFEKIKDEEPRAPRGLNPTISRDLEAIILTALDKERDRRYATAEDLAEDLRRFCAFEPVKARPAGRMLKTLRWIQRNRLVTATAGIVMLAILTAAVVFYVKGEEAKRARGHAEAALAAETKEREAKEAALAEKTAALATAEIERNAKTAALADREKALSDYDRLADIKRLEAAIAASDALYPPSPALLPRLEAWQKEHGFLAGKIEGHRGFLIELRARALPYAEEERKRDFATELSEIARSRSAIAEIDQDIASAAEGEAREALLERKAALVARRTDLEALITTGRRSWRFEDQVLQFQHDLLADLVSKLEDFATSETGPVQSVATRIVRSRAIAHETIEDERAERWSTCRERIRRNARYSDLDLEPQLGLIPMGPDPESGLEEFLHWLTHEGPIPERDSRSGKIAVQKELGIVLVLIPGGTFLMGTQKDDPTKPNFDPDSQPDEQPVHAVTLAPYFLSKYEMTQAQWLRVAHENPSQYRPGTTHAAFKRMVDSRHPVERVSWEDAQLQLRRIDLLLPTEAEWERAARAGRTDQVFAGCRDAADLDRFANISGEETRAVGFPNRQEGHEDDFIVHAPVGSFAPNAFGLHDMTGNVWEWCQDGQGESYSDPPGPRGLRADPSRSPNRQDRGGSFDFAAITARLANRNFYPLINRYNTLGLRPARLISN